MSLPFGLGLPDYWVPLRGLKLSKFDIIMWIFIALGSSLFYGFANVLDNFLTNRLFKSIWTLVFFGMCIDLVFLPIVCFISPPSLPPLNLVPFILIIGFLEIFYLWPYYKALQTDDTSVVSSLFSIGRIFIPFFAFLIIGEVVQPAQYLGFFFVILSSSLLTLKDVRHLKLNKSFFYMVLVSIMLAMDTVLYKLILDQMSWGTAFVFVQLSSCFFAFCFLFVPKIRKDIFRHFKEAKHTFKFLALEEVMAFSANATSAYVLSLVPITVARGLSAFIPFIVLFYGAVLQKYYPKFFHENVERGNILKKIFLFGLTLIGVFLILQNGGTM